MFGKSPPAAPTPGPPVSKPSTPAKQCYQEAEQHDRCAHAFPPKMGATLHPRSDSLGGMYGSACSLLPRFLGSGQMLRHGLGIADRWATPPELMCKWHVRQRRQPMQTASAVHGMASRSECKVRSRQGALARVGGNSPPGKAWRAKNWARWMHRWLMRNEGKLKRRGR